jgi:hypothetical protein
MMANNNEYVPAKVTITRTYELDPSIDPFTESGQEAIFDLYVKWALEGLEEGPARDEAMSADTRTMLADLIYIWEASGNLDGLFLPHQLGNNQVAWK